MTVKILGQWDLLLYIIAHEQKEFHHTIKQIKNEFSGTIRNYDTFVAFKEHYFNPMPKAIK